MLDSLSEELVLEIIQILHDQELEERYEAPPSRSYVPYINPVSDGLERIDSVTSLASTSKRLRRIAFPILFHTLAISYSADESPDYEQDMAAGRAVLQSFASNCAFVKCLIITFLEPWGEDEWLFPGPEEDFLVRDVMPALPNLEELKFNMEPPPLTHQIISACNEKPSFRFLHIWTAVNPWVDLPDDVSLNKVRFGVLHFGANGSKKLRIETNPVKWIKWVNRGAGASSLIVHKGRVQEWLKCTFAGLRELHMVDDPDLSHQFLDRHPLLSSIRFGDAITYLDGRNSESLCLLQQFYSALRVAELPVRPLINRAEFDRIEPKGSWDTTFISVTLKDMDDADTLLCCMRVACENLPILRSIIIETTKPSRISAKGFWQKSGLYLCHKIESVTLNGFSLVLEGDSLAHGNSDRAVFVREMMQSAPSHKATHNWNALAWERGYIHLKLEEQETLSVTL